MKNILIKSIVIYILLILLSFKSLAEEITSKASFYGKEHQGKLMANGKKFNMYAMTAAHKYLKFNTIVKVTNLNNNKSVIVRITDRGPFKANRDLDLSYGAFSVISNINVGVIPIKYEIID